MKKQVLLLITCGFFFFPSYSESLKLKGCDLEIDAQWKDIEDAHTKKEEDTFGGRWMLAGTFVFRNRSGDNVPLSELDLLWKGTAHIKHLNGSLFKKEPNKEFMPLEEQLVCDGHWNEDRQLLQLKFNEKHYIGSRTIFCLALTVPKNLEPALDTGHFTVDTTHLPRQLKKSVKKRQPILSTSPTPSAPKKKRRLAYRSAMRNKRIS